MEERRSARRKQSQPAPKPAAPSIIQQITDFFNFDKQLAKDGKPIMRTSPTLLHPWQCQTYLQGLIADHAQRG